MFPDGPRLIKSEVPPVRLSDPRPPVGIRETASGTYTVDFGQNRAGVVWLRARGARGTRIVIRTSELLGKDGKIDPWTNRRAQSTDTFILAGTGKPETYLPRFTYHGFRYAEISGWPGKLTADDVRAYAVHADLRRTASFRCSDDTLNWLHEAATWSMLSNFSARRQTPHGEVSVDWRRVGTQIDLRVSSPEKVPTRLVLPDGRTLEVRGMTRLTVTGSCKRHTQVARK